MREVGAGMEGSGDRPVGTPLARESGLADRVARHLTEMVLNGSLTRGVQLPSERILAEQFGVSRTVIREAVRSLTSKGMLEIRAGSGTYVRGPDVAAAAESITLLLRLHHGGGPIAYQKALEIRQVLEIEIAGLAAERATPDDLAALAAELERLRGAEHDRETFVAADVAFHAALAAATHNELFVVVLDSISDVLREVRRLGFETPEGHASAVRYHARLLEAARAGDAAAARRAMTEHLQDAAQILRHGLEIEAARQEPDG
jgi:GntR family transcriptional repressor for pyruvate dehydrogenase complex